MTSEQKRIEIAHKVNDALKDADVPAAIEILIGLAVMSAQISKIPRDWILKAVADCWRETERVRKEAALEKGDA